MPSHSVKQAKVMSAIAHGWHPAGLDIPVKVAKEFHQADKGHKYGAGRAFGGVAPMLAQASNPVMPSLAAGVAPIGSSMPGPAQNASTPFLRPMKRGGTAHGKLIKHKGMTTGPLVSTVPGRTDLHLTHVPSGSYVIPADIVSGHGQGNSLAGMEHLHNLFRMDQKHPIEKLFRGGTTDRHIGKPVPVKLAGGEIVVPPGNLHETMSRISGKKLSLEEAHRAMDKWVLLKRKKLRRTLSKLKPPVNN